MVLFLFRPIGDKREIEPRLNLVGLGRQLGYLKKGDKIETLSSERLLEFGEELVELIGPQTTTRKFRTFLKKTPSKKIETVLKTLVSRHSDRLKTRGGGGIVGHIPDHLWGSRTGTRIVRGRNWVGHWGL